MRTIVCWLIGVLVVANVPCAGCEEFQPIDEEAARRIATRLVDLAGALENLQVKIDPDPEKAAGVHIPQKAGMLLVPHKGLNEEKIDGAKTDPGAPLAYLFQFRLVQVVDGKRVEESKLRSVTLEAGDRTLDLHVSLLSARQLSDEDWRLNVFGAAAKPLLQSKFTQANQGEGPITIQIQDRQGREAKAVVTVFEKYRASFPVQYVQAD